MDFQLERILCVGICAAAGLNAASRLQLSQTILPTVTLGQGANGSTSVDAKNIGDGSLNLKVTGSAPWLVPTVGTTHACTDGSGPACLPVNIALNTSPLAKGTYVGVVTVYDPNAIDAPQSVAVSAQIGSGVPDKIEFFLPQGSSASTDFRSGLATVTASTSDPKAVWLSVAQDGGSPFSPTLPYKVSVTSGGLAMGVGDYSGSVTVSGSTNGADNKTIPVTLHVVPQAVSGPLSAIGGAVNNATYLGGEALAQGDIVALFGSQFIGGAPGGAISLPLGTTLDGVQVLLNGQPAPVFYVSANQLNFQIPFNAAVGAATLQVVSNGILGNTIGITIAKAIPRILRLDGKYGDYGVITNADNTLPIPTALGGTPAKVGGTIVIYAIGFGPTSPAVDSGAGSPTSPLALLTDNPKVCFSAPTPFSAGVCTKPAFAGLAPGFVGLYQINVAIPEGSPTGDLVPVYITADDGATNTVEIAVRPQ